MPVLGPQSAVVEDGTTWSPFASVPGLLAGIEDRQVTDWHCLPMGAWWNRVISADQPQWLASSYEGLEDWPVSLPRVFGGKSLRLGRGRLPRGAFSCRWITLCKTRCSSRRTRPGGWRRRLLRAVSARSSSVRHGCLSSTPGTLGGCAVSVYPRVGIRYTFVLCARGPADRCEWSEALGLGAVWSACVSTLAQELRRRSGGCCQWNMLTAF